MSFEPRTRKRERERRRRWFSIGGCKYYTSKEWVAWMRPFVIEGIHSWEEKTMKTSELLFKQPRNFTTSAPSSIIILMPHAVLWRLWAPKSFSLQDGSNLKEHEYLYGRPAAQSFQKLRAECHSMASSEDLFKWHCAYISDQWRLFLNSPVVSIVSVQIILVGRKTNIDHVRNFGNCSTFAQHCLCWTMGKHSWKKRQTPGKKCCLIKVIFVRHIFMTNSTLEGKQRHALPTWGSRRFWELAKSSSFLFISFHSKPSQRPCFSSLWRGSDNGFVDGVVNHEVGLKNASANAQPTFLDPFGRIFLQTHPSMCTFGKKTPRMDLQ